MELWSETAAEILTERINTLAFCYLYQTNRQEARFVMDVGVVYRNTANQLVCELGLDKTGDEDLKGIKSMRHHKSWFCRIRQGNLIHKPSGFLAAPIILLCLSMSYLTATQTRLCVGPLLHF
jgi:hypothetical protein